MLIGVGIYTFASNLIEQPIEIIEIKQGSITIINMDDTTELPIKNSEYTITKLESGDIVERLITDQEGKATSALYDYDMEFEIRQVKVPSIYQIDNEAVIDIKISEDNYEFVTKNKIHQHIEAFLRTADGEYVINEVYIPVPTVMQKPELPNGCEITALTAVLNYLGYDVSKTEMADSYLPQQAFFREGDKLFGANPYIAFAGNPRDQNGFFVYAPPIVEAANSYIETMGGTHTAVDISKSTREEIIQELNNGNPIVIWSTIDQRTARFNYSWYLIENGEYFQAATNLHALVINGYVEDKVHVMDPLEGQILYDADTFFEHYYGLGSVAVAVY